MCVLNELKQYIGVYNLVFLGLFPTFPWGFDAFVEFIYSTEICDGFLVSSFVFFIRICTEVVEMSV